MQPLGKVWSEWWPSRYAFEVQFHLMPTQEEAAIFFLRFFLFLFLLLLRFSFALVEMRCMACDDVLVLVTWLGSPLENRRWKFKRRSAGATGALVDICQALNMRRIWVKGTCMVRILAGPGCVCEKADCITSIITVGITAIANPTQPCLLAMMFKMGTILLTQHNILAQFVSEGCSAVNNHLKWHRWDSFF